MSVTCVGRKREMTYIPSRYVQYCTVFFYFSVCTEYCNINVIIFQCVCWWTSESQFLVFFADTNTMGRHRSRSVSRGRRRADSGGPRSAGGRALRLKSESDSSAERRRRKRDSKRRQASRSSSGGERSRHRTKVKKEKKRSKKKKRRRSSESSDEATDTDSIRYYTALFSILALPHIVFHLPFFPVSSLNFQDLPPWFKSIGK